MNKVRTIELSLTSLALIYLAICLILIPIDIISFFDDQETYAKVHDLGAPEKWATTYLSRWLFPGLSIVVGVIVTSLRLIKRENRIIRKFNLAFLSTTILIVAVGIFKWSLNGFDH